MNNIYFPAEWAKQSAIMLTWPHQDTDWSELLDDVTTVYFDIAKAVLKHQNLLISCEDKARLDAAESELSVFAKDHNTKLFAYLIEADDTWARDHGPIGIIENGQTKLLDFTFNAWGGKFASSKDDLITKRLHAQGAFGSTPLESIPFILEGGSIESDGEGSLLTTEHCLLTDTRNAALSKQDIEQTLKMRLGAEQVLWLSEGYLRGDDTDAHIDTLARFCPENRICYMSCNNPEDEHYAPLQAMENELRAMKNARGEPYTLEALPFPEPIYSDGRRLSATYANFLITNQSVLVPVYGVTEDEEALAVINRCFPEREIVPINCRTLIEQNGSLHCITMQLLEGVCA